MVGLRIKTVTGKEFEVIGKVTYKDTPEGRVYYCNDSSYPEEIVTEVKKWKSTRLTLTFIT